MTVVLTVEGREARPALVLPLPLNLPTVQWIAEAFLRGGDPHPLHPHLPKTRFAFLAINHLESVWRVSFSRRSKPSVLSCQGRAIEVCWADRAELSLSIQEGLAVDVRRARKAPDAG